MVASVLRKDDNLFVQLNLPIKAIGVPCDCMNVTKLIKANFSRNFFWKIIYLLRILPLNFHRKITKHIGFQSAINYLYIGIIFIH